MNKNNLTLPIIDTLAASGALYLSFALRFEFHIPLEFFKVFTNWIPWIICIHISIFFVGQMYSRIWRYTSLFDLYAIIMTVFISCSVNYLVILISMGGGGYPRSVLILYPIFLTIFSILPRLSIRVYYSHYHKDAPFKNQPGFQPIKRGFC